MRSQISCTSGNAGIDATLPAAIEADIVNDAECTAFLQWALPQLDLRWPGFRKVRRQVCKRLKQRMRDIGVNDYPAYCTRLEADPSEWQILDACCHITISRFFRDRGIFEVVRRRGLPDIAARARREKREARVWSAGCASGEEPYTSKNTLGHRGRQRTSRRFSLDRRLRCRQRNARARP